MSGTGNGWNFLAVRYLNTAVFPPWRRTNHKNEGNWYACEARESRWTLDLGPIYDV